MALFSKGVTFVKEDSNAEKQLEVLKNLRASATGKVAEALDIEIRNVEAGIFGENQIKFELENSHIPMYVLHDLYFEYNGLSAQIDYLIITNKRQFVIECKNLYGNIEINNNGDFIRTIQLGNGKYKKEGIYSPITQNQRHLDLIREMRSADKSIIAKPIFEKNFSTYYKSVVVLANPKTYLNDKFAKKEIKQQVIRADQLIQFIKKANDEMGTLDLKTDKEMQDLANYYLSQNKQQNIDYTLKYKAMLEKQSQQPETTQKTEPLQILCPKCGAPMVKRIAKSGPNAGNEFYGCSKYPNCNGIVSIK